VIDGRLLIPAAALWAGAGLTLAGGVRAAVIAFVLAAAAAALVAIVRPTARLSACLTVLFVLLGIAAAGVATWRADPVAQWLHDGASAHVVGAIAGEPRLHRAPPSAQWWARDSLTVRLLTRSVTARGTTTLTQVPIRLRLAPDAEPPPRGTVVEVSGRLVPVDPGSGLVAELRVGTEPWLIEGEPGLLDSAATAMRAGLSRSLADAPAAPAALVEGLTLGDDSAAPEALAQSMRASGLAHLLAVSGSNVAIVVGSVVALAAMLRRSLLVRVALGLVALAYYAFLVGPEPSVLRASVMGAIVLVGVLVGGRRGGPAVLATGVIGLLLVQPSLALSWGFALSAIATGGIVLIAPPLCDRLARWRPTARLPPALGQAAAVTLAAQVATLPVLVLMGAAVGWIAIPANLLAMPAVAPVTVLGLVSSVTAPVLPWLGEAAARLAVIPASWIAVVAEVAPRLPAAGWPVAALPTGWVGLLVLAALVVLLGVALRLRRSRWWGDVPIGLRRVLAGAGVVALVLAVVRPPQMRGWPPENWLLVMCDVGQGDALLLRAGPDSAVVVDTGASADAAVDCLDAAGVRQVPVVVLTHFHADHVGGLAGVLRARDVGQVLATPLADPRDQARLASAAARDAGLSVLPMTAGDARRVGQVEWRALWPRRIIRAGSVANNASVVLLADIAGLRVLLTGDIEPEAQAALAAEVARVHPGIDVVKVPHHGSVHQSREFARAVGAPVALISVGADNDYGHPAEQTIRLYAGGGALVLRTDEHGDIAVLGTGSGAEVVVRHGMLPSS